MNPTVKLVSFDRHVGFTLLEILIALFIFSIVSLILASALRNIIGIQSGTEANALRLRNLQMALLLISRDVEQAVNRPILDTKGMEEAAFVGNPRSFIFTHLGSGAAMAASLQTDMQRVRYYWEGTKLWRSTWHALDQPPQAKPQLRAILGEITETRFQYLDKDGYIHDRWPVEGKETEIMPRAISINLNLTKWGKISQLYVIPAENPKNHGTAQTPTPDDD